MGQWELSQLDFIAVNRNCETENNSRQQQLSI
jgi:hypothetical protein